MTEYRQAVPIGEVYQDRVARQFRCTDAKVIVFDSLDNAGIADKDVVGVCHARHIYRGKRISIHVREILRSNLQCRTRRRRIAYASATVFDRKVCARPVVVVDRVLRGKVTKSD